MTVIKPSIKDVALVLTNKTIYTGGSINCDLIKPSIQGAALDVTVIKPSIKGLALVLTNKTIYTGCSISCD